MGDVELDLQNEYFLKEYYIREVYALRPLSVNSNVQKLGRRASDARADVAASPAPPRKEARPAVYNPPLNVTSYYMRHMLNLMHTNSDCRYAPNSNKNVEKTMGYVPTLTAGLLDEQDSLTEESQNEPVFTQQALAICRRLRLHSAPPSRPLLPSDAKAASLDGTLTEEEEYFRLDSSYITATDVEGSGAHCSANREDSVLPIFFNGPLSGALKLVERATGCAWPAIILLLFNTSSPGNNEFFRNVLCKSVASPKVETSEQTQTEVTAGDVSTLSDNDCRRYTCLNEFILERGIKIIPWDCTLLKYKMMLATAFRGTRLQQWLQTLNERTEYPALVAVGRTGSGRVVCSKMDGTKVDLRQTLHWLDVVTKAHFCDYVMSQPSELKAKYMDASLSSVEPSTRLICGAGELTGSSVEKTKGRGLTTNRDTMTLVVFEEFAKQEQKPTKERATVVQNSFVRINRQKSLFSEQEKLKLQMMKEPPVQKGLPVATCLAQGAIADATTLTIPEIQPSDWLGADQLTDFMTRFLDRFASGLPVTPVFLLTRFSTAVARCLNPISGEQLKPFLLYLHDDDGVGTPHFVANVLSSRRFSNRLYDANIAIWPVDLTGVMKPQRSSLMARSPPRHAPPRVAATATALPVPTTRRSGNKPLPPPLSHTRKPPTPSVPPLTPPRPNYRSLAACVTSRDRVREQHSVPPPSAEATQPRKPKPLRRYFWQPPLPRMAEHLLLMFAQHPAGATLNVLVSKKMLPSLLSLRLDKGKFSVDAILFPNSTTKEGVIWLTKAIRRFEKNFLHPPSVNRAPVIEQSYT